MQPMSTLASSEGSQMPADGNTGASPTPVPKKRNHRRVRKPFDGRYALGRRVHQLVDVFAARIPDADDPVTAAAIERAARLTALSEQASARALCADPAVSLDDVVRLHRASDYAVRRLRLDQRNNTKQAPTLSSYLAARGGEQP